MATISIHPPDAPALDMFYEEHGTGAPVVMIGGLTSSLEVYQRQVEGLSPRYRIITPDNRGSGRTVIIEDDGGRAIERMAADILTFLDALDLGRVHLCGASMGGMIVQQFAVAHPERLLSLTIGCSHGGSPTAISPSDEIVGILLAGSQDDATEEAFLANQEMMFAPASLGEDRERFEFYLHTKRLRPHSADEVSRRMHAIIEYDVWDQLPQLDIPTLVITGADDNLVPPQNSERLAERIRGARLEILSDAGHIFWIEQPEATNRALSEHFESVA